jgi:hypothetical protein
MHAERPRDTCYRLRCKSRFELSSIYASREPLHTAAAERLESDTSGPNCGSTRPPKDDTRHYDSLLEGERF